MSEDEKDVMAVERYISCVMHNGTGNVMDENSTVSCQFCDGTGKIDTNSPRAVVVIAYKTALEQEQVENDIKKERKK